MMCEEKRTQLFIVVANYQETIELAEFVLVLVVLA